ncbi:MAG: hypothetical protein AAB658_19625 [Chloroflexota bacterium]
MQASLDGHPQRKNKPFRPAKGFREYNTASRRLPATSTTPILRKQYVIF